MGDINRTPLFSWRPTEDGVDVHTPDPSGMTEGLTIALPFEVVERMYLAARAEQLGADKTGDL